MKKIFEGRRISYDQIYNSFTIYFYVRDEKGELFCFRCCTRGLGGKFCINNIKESWLKIKKFLGGSFVNKDLHFYEIMEGFYEKDIYEPLWSILQHLKEVHNAVQE